MLLWDALLVIFKFLKLFLKFYQIFDFSSKRLLCYKHFLKALSSKLKSVFVIDFLFNYKTYIKKKHRFVCNALQNL